MLGCMLDNGKQHAGRDSRMLGHMVGERAAREHKRHACSVDTHPWEECVCAARGERCLEDVSAGWGGHHEACALRGYAQGVQARAAEQGQGGGTR